jgi:hypothetical protein
VLRMLCLASPDGARPTTAHAREHARLRSLTSARYLLLVGASGQVHLFAAGIDPRVAEPLLIRLAEGERLLYRPYSRGVTLATSGLDDPTRVAAVEAASLAVQPVSKSGFR